MLNKEEEGQVTGLLRAQRWASLATLDHHGLPHVSMVAYALATVADKGCLVLHLSRLAAHTRHLIDSPQVSLAISEADTFATNPVAKDPQSLARISLNGSCMVTSADAAEYSSMKESYILRLPDSRQLFSFSDFQLICMMPEKGRYVGGFGRASSFRWEDLVLA